MANSDTGVQHCPTVKRERGGKTSPTVKRETGGETHINPLQKAPWHKDHSSTPNSETGTEGRLCSWCSLPEGFRRREMCLF